MSNNYTVMEFLHVGDTILWVSPDDGQPVGPAAITGLWESGIDAEGHPGQGVTISPMVVRGISYASLPAILISKRIAAADGSTMHFQFGQPV